MGKVHKLPEQGWTKALQQIIRQCASGDVIEVRSESQKLVVEMAAFHHGKDVTVRLVEDEG